MSGTAYIVWNEDRSEGVIFVEKIDAGVQWTTPKQDASQARTGRRAHRGIGSSLAEAFHELYGDDKLPPVQTVSAALFDR